jgi:hypothetical protein
MIWKIVSGGQTGVDRAALDFAIRNGIAHGGYCPKGRRSESSRIPDKYSLIETSSSDYPMRTALNVQHSDGTLIISRGHPTGGTKLTVNNCISRQKERFIIDANRKVKVDEFLQWVREKKIGILNVAGPRDSKQSGIAKDTKRILAELFEALDKAGLVKRIKENR